MLNQLLTIFSIFAIFYSSAQKKVELFINPTSVEVGETFSITVKSDFQGELNFDKVPSTFVQDYTIHQGSTREMDHSTGNVKIVQFFSFTGVITTSGKFKIGPAYITNGSVTHASNSVTITVGKRAPMSTGDVTYNQLQDPAFGIIEVNKKTIYEGEPLLVQSKIYATYNPSHVGIYNSYVVPGATIKYPIGNTTIFKKSIEKFKGKDFFSFPYDKNVIFPSGIGKYKIEPFQMNLHQGYQNFPLVSNAIEITILPLPGNAPVDFIGAVGDFRIEREIDAQGLKQGDVMKIFVTISGIGNLQNIDVPSLNLPQGFSIYGDPMVTENIAIGPHGAEGEVTYEYNIEIKKSGDLTFPSTTISFFDPDKEKYVQVKTIEFKFNVEKNDNYIAHDIAANSEKNTELVIHQSKIKENAEIIDNGDFFGSAPFWGALGTPILASFLFLLFIRRKDKFEDKALAKRQKAVKDNAFKECVLTAKSLLESGNDSEFYSQIENAIKKAFEIEMNFEEDRLINKTDINNFIEKSSKSELLPMVNSIFSNCEQSKYGFSSSNTTRSEILEELKRVINRMNQVKW